VENIGDTFLRHSVKLLGCRRRPFQAKLRIHIIRKQKV